MIKTNKMSKFEKYKKINGIPYLDGKLVEIEGICAGVVCRSGFLGLYNIYSGVLEKNGEQILFTGNGTLSSTDGDLEATLAKLSESKSISAVIQGRLYLNHYVDDQVRYGIEVSGIKVNDITSCFFNP